MGLLAKQPLGTKLHGAPALLRRGQRQDIGHQGFEGNSGRLKPTEPLAHALAINRQQRNLSALAPQNHQMQGVNLAGHLLLEQVGERLQTLSVQLARQRDLPKQHFRTGHQANNRPPSGSLAQLSQRRSATEAATGDDLQFTLGPDQPVDRIQGLSPRRITKYSFTPSLHTVGGSPQPCYYPAA